MKNLDIIKDQTKRQSFYKRFEKYVIKSEDKNSCWKWKGAKSSNGYPVLSMGVKERLYRVSRLLLHDIKEIPFPEASVLHKCDNPECTNPLHLSWGTHKENMNDCLGKGRMFRPPVLHRDLTSRCRIKTKDIHKILILADSKNCKEISIIYSVNEETIRRLLNKHNKKALDKRLYKNKKL